MDYFLPIVSSALMLVFAGYQYQVFSKISLEKNKVSELSELVSEGITAFYKRVLSASIQIVVYSILVLLLFSWLFEKTLSLTQLLAFIFGSSVMGLSGFLSLTFVPKLVPKIIQQSKGYLSEGLMALFNTSITLSFTLIGSMVLGLTLSYVILGAQSIIGFGLGSILTSFFLRVGGGLYKTGADIASDSMHFLESKLPDFDTRNPATLLDISGDYIGKITGFSSDILSSFIFSVIACILFANSLLETKQISAQTAASLTMLPMYIFCMGILASIIAYFYYRFRLKSQTATNVLLEGMYLAVFLSGFGTWAIMQGLDVHIEVGSLWGSSPEFSPFAPYFFGLVGAILIGFSSEYLTANWFKPAKKIASEAEFGPVVTLLNSILIGYKSNGLFLIYILVMIVPSFFFAGLYGVALASMGMLSVTGLIITLSMFSALASNTLKTTKLCQSSDTTLKNAVKMNSLGHTTAALGNGFAAGASIMSTFSLFFALIVSSKMSLSQAFLVDLDMFIGLLIGISIPYVYAGFLLNGLVLTIRTSLTEVVRQFKDIPYLFENKAKPDMTKASDLLAKHAMDSLIIPGIVMIMTPIIIGYVFGIKMLLGLTLGVILIGFSKGFSWANTGDSLHSARHFIEKGHFGGKDSPTYAHIAIADGVGDAAKDLLGPSLTLFIKAVTIIAILIVLLL